MSEENTELNRQGKTTDDLVIAKRQWERVRSRLRAELGEATFNSWFRHLEILKATATSITIQVPTKFIGSCWPLWKKPLELTIQTRSTP